MVTNYYIFSTYVRALFFSFSLSHDHLKVSGVINHKPCIRRYVSTNDAQGKGGLWGDGEGEFSASTLAIQPMSDILAIKSGYCP